jgi:hypothetical protein
VQSRPLYQQECAANDDRYIQQLETICADLIGSVKGQFNSVTVARVLRFTSEGLWNDMLSMNEPYSRQEALDTLFACAARFFPDHFPENGRT